jgi:hypothetical protein
MPRPARTDLWVYDGAGGQITGIRPQALLPEVVLCWLSAGGPK